MVMRLLYVALATAAAAGCAGPPKTAARDREFVVMEVGRFG